MHRIAKFIEGNFFIFIFIAASLGIVFPNWFIWIKPHIPKLLGIIMFGMGIVLQFSDFVRVWHNRKLVLIGVLMQYTIMPLLALLISKVFNLPFEIMIGMIIVGACPGGTASNVVAYIAKANVALSVSMTLISTLLAPVLTPAIIYLVLSQRITLSFFVMVKSVFWIVVFPLIDGLLIRHFLSRKIVNPLIVIFPSISIIAIGIAVACITALNRELLLTFPYFIIIPVILHNGLGFVLGYLIPYILKYQENDCRTIAIEIGMQNSGLGVSLATQFFTVSTALVGAIFSVWHNIAGITLANYWADREVKE